MTFFLVLGTIFLTSGLFSRYQIIYIVLAAQSYLWYFTPWKTGEWFSVLLFLIGILFLIVEIYIPGFGLAGVVGTLSVATGLYLNTGSYMLTSLLILLMVVCAIFTSGIMMKRGRMINISPRLVLNRSIQSQSKSASYTHSIKELSVGQIGVARTALRPIGEADFNGKLYEVTSDEGFISQETPLEIVQLTGSKIIVKKGMQDDRTY